MSKCKKCDRDIALPKDKYCGACVHNAYAELEAELTALRDAALDVVNFFNGEVEPVNVLEAALLEVKGE